MENAKVLFNKKLKDFRLLELFTSMAAYYYIVTLFFCFYILCETDEIARCQKSHFKLELAEIEHIYFRYVINKSHYDQIF